MPDGEYKVSARIYLRDRHKIQEIQLERQTRLRRQVTIAEVISDAVKLLVKSEEQRRAREIAQ